MSDQSPTGKLLKKRTNLSLKMETLRTLRADLLDGVHGGAPATPNSVIPFSDVYTCVKTQSCPAPEPKPDPKKKGGGGGDFWKWLASAAASASLSGISDASANKTYDGKCKDFTKGSDFC